MLLALGSGVVGVGFVMTFPVTLSRTIMWSGPLTGPVEYYVQETRARAKFPLAGYI